MTHRKRLLGQDRNLMQLGTADSMRILIEALERRIQLSFEGLENISMDFSPIGELSANRESYIHVRLMGDGLIGKDPSRAFSWIDYRNGTGSLGYLQPTSDTLWEGNLRVFPSQAGTLEYDFVLKFDSDEAALAGSGPEYAMNWFDSPSAFDSVWSADAYVPLSLTVVNDDFEATADPLYIISEDPLTQPLATFMPVTPVADPANYTVDVSLRGGQIFEEQIDMANLEDMMAIAENFEAEIRVNDAGAWEVYAAPGTTILPGQFATVIEIFSSIDSYDSAWSISSSITSNTRQVVEEGVIFQTGEGEIDGEPVDEEILEMGTTSEGEESSGEEVTFGDGEVIIDGEGVIFQTGAPAAETPQTEQSVITPIARAETPAARSSIWNSVGIDARTPVSKNSLAIDLQGDEKQSDRLEI